MKTLFEKTKNPLNIRYVSSNDWKGQTSSYCGFCVFKSADYGYRAAFVLICSYIRKGYNTVSSIITRWAPPTENDTETYILYICSKTNLTPHSILGLGTRHNYWNIIILIAAMAYMENGISVQPQDINLALGRVL